jgi:NADP-dependent 3-hydroxy acid dehydrogenase YdfG
VLSRALDVRDAAAVGEFALQVAEWTPQPIGMVFNNAGVWLAQTATDGSDDDEAWLHDINFHGVLNGVKAFLPILLEQRSGAIVNTSSVFALMGVPMQTGYCASKYAVRGYTDALRQELRGSGVRAVIVYPGGTSTNIVANGRAFSDPAYMDRDHATLTLHHAADSMTSPERAAGVIQRGVERGKARILIGIDAHLTDLCTRVSPTHAFAVLEHLHRERLRRIARR